MGAARQAANLAPAVHGPDRRIAELMQRDVEQGDIYVAALPGFARAHDR